MVRARENGRADLRGCAGGNLLRRRAARFKRAAQARAPFRGGSLRAAFRFTLAAVLRGLDGLNLPGDAGNVGRGQNRGGNSCFSGLRRLGRVKRMMAGI